MCRISMPLKNKATARSGRKGKGLKKQADPPPPPTSKSGGEEEDASVRDLLMNMTDMMASLNTRLQAIEGDSRKKRKVAFRGEAPATRTTGQRLTTPSRASTPNRQASSTGGLTTENMLPPLPTTSRPDYDKAPTLLSTVHERREPQTADSLLAQLTASPTTGNT